MRLFHDDIRTPARRPELFMLIVIVTQLALLIFWEAYASERFATIVAGNPDPVDRLFYGRIGEGMAAAMLLLLAASVIISVVVLFRRNIPVSIRDVLNCRSERQLILIFLILSALLQLSFLFLLSPPPFSDSQYYVSHAERLVETGSYITADGARTAFWPVGYPAFLALLEVVTGNMILVGRLFNILFVLFIIAATWRLFHDALSRNQRLLLVAAMAFHPLILFAAAPLMTDQCFLALLMGALLAARMPDAWFKPLVLAALLSAMVYVRPAGLLIAALLLLVLLLAGLSKRQVVLTAILVICALTPWTIRNYAVFHRLVPVATNGGYNFLMGNHSGAGGGLNFDFSYPDTENEAVASRNAYRRAIEDMRRDPLQALARIPRKVAHSYRRGDATILWSVKPVHRSLPPWLLAALFYAGNLAWYVMVGFGLLALVLKRVRLRTRLQRYLLTGVVTAVFLMIALYVGGERYVFPLFPFHAYLFARFFPARA